MQTIQRSVLVCLVISVFVWGMAAVGREKEEKFYQQWEQVQVERFLSKLCRSGSCSYEEYEILYRALNYYGMDSKIQIEEYRREQDMERNVYYYLMSWEEIQEHLAEEGRYTFEQGSILRIVVVQKSRSQSITSRYSHIVSGKEG